MPRSRREFLTDSSLGLMSVAIAASTGCSQKTQETPGTPPVFGTSPPVGPAVSPQTFAEAEKLVQVEMTAKDLAQAAGNWQQSLASVYGTVPAHGKFFSKRTSRPLRSGIPRCRKQQPVPQRMCSPSAPLTRPLSPPARTTSPSRLLLGSLNGSSRGRLPRSGLPTSTSCGYRPSIPNCIASLP